MRMTQAAAADALGYSRRRIISYDIGDDYPPKIVLLGMLAVENGLSPQIKDAA